jgi:hypothetical protein
MSDVGCMEREIWSRMIKAYMHILFTCGQTYATTNPLQKASNFAIVSNLWWRMCGTGDAPNPIDRVDSSSWYFAAICRNPSDEATDPYKTPTNVSPISTNVDCGDDEEIIAWIPSPSNEPPHGKLDTRILTDNANDSTFERLTLQTRPSSNPLLSKSLKFQKRSSRSEIHFAPYQPTRSSSVDHLADKMKRWNMRNAPSQQPQLLIDPKTPADS